MIEYIKGDIVELTPTQMIIECAGIGYELNISLTTYSAFSGKPTGKIYVYEVIREDAHLLFGFAQKVERELFLLLTSVSGVGPNTARMILSSLPPSELIQVIANKNETALTSVKGIGQKTAQRILVDLKNKVKAGDSMVGTGTAATAGRRSGGRPGYVGIPKGCFTKGSQFNTENLADAGCGTSDKKCTQNALIVDR